MDWKDEFQTALSTLLDVINRAPDRDAVSAKAANLMTVSEDGLGNVPSAIKTITIRIDTDAVGFDVCRRNP